MQNQIKVTLCKNCQGRGIIPGTSNLCENCKGVGALGYDGINDYYLKVNENGNLEITEIKQEEKPQSQPAKTETVAAQKNNFFKYLAIIFLVLLYVGFLGLNFALIKNTKLLIIITILFVGSIVLFVLYDAKLLNKLVSGILRLFIQEPNDFSKAVKNIEKRSMDLK